jgi:hypothetical protein
MQAMPTYTKIWLKLEGLAVLVASIGVFIHIDASWWLFVALILAPDLGMLGYLRSARVGAFTYNLLHVYAWPGALTVWFLAGGPAWTAAVATVWAAHLGVDRALGFGLKGPDSFQQTHLGWVGE